MEKIHRSYSDADVIENAKNVESLSELLKSLGLRPVGGNYANMKRILQKLNVDTSNWKGQAWSRGRQMKDWSRYTRVRSIKKHLINLRSNTCDCCGLSTWMENPIPLAVHHIDGDRTNNEFSNLKLLCCNCHALTDFWRGKKNGCMAKQEETRQA